MANLNFLEESKILYNISFRTGMAIAALDFCEKIVEKLFPEEYKIEKYKIRRLSEYEAKIILTKLIEKADINFLYEFI